MCWPDFPHRTFRPGTYFGRKSWRSALPLHLGGGFKFHYFLFSSPSGEITLWDQLTYTWLEDGGAPEWVDVFPIEHGHTPASYVRNYQRVWNSRKLVFFKQVSNPVTRLRSLNHLGGCSKKRSPKNWIFICSILKIWGTEMLFPPKKTSVTQLSWKNSKIHQLLFPTNGWFYRIFQLMSPGTFLWLSWFLSGKHWSSLQTSVSWWTKKSCEPRRIFPPREHEKSPARVEKYHPCPKFNKDTQNSKMRYIDTFCKSIIFWYLIFWGVYV